MAIKKTKSGYQIRWYDADGRERKRTYKQYSRLQAEKKERELLGERDRGEQPLDVQHVPTFGAFAATWIEDSAS